MRIGIVNDLPVAVEALRRALASSPEHRVAWVARDGAEAVSLCARNRPDLVLMDLVMPVLDGVEAVRRIMRDSPCPILVVTATVTGRAGRVFEALGAGALDAVDTPVLSGPGAEQGFRALLGKIALLGRIIAPAFPPSHRSPVPASPAPGRPGGSGPWLFALGTSAGGPAALAAVLGAFPRGLAAAVVAVPHLDRSFAPGLAEWLGGQTALPVRLAREGDAPEPGTVLLPSREDHLVLDARGRLAYTADPADYVYRPSVDAFLESVALRWPGNAAGVILTGMGRDGARGLKKMREAGFPTLAQDRASCAVYGMPKAAAELGAAERVLPLSAIGPALIELLTPPNSPP